MRLMLLGAPGSGKRALIKRIAAERRIPLITAADPSAGNRDPAGDGELQQRLASSDADQGFILDITPENPDRAAALDRLLSDLGVPLDLVLQIDIGPEALLERLSNRLSCRDCGATCNLFANPPRVEGACDHCGGPLRRDPLASDQTLHQQLQRYRDRIQHLLDYYQEEGRLRRIRGEAEPRDLYRAARRILETMEQTDGATGDWLPPIVPVPATAADPGTATQAHDDAPTPTVADEPGTARKSGSWKQAAESRGRIKRRSATTGRTRTVKGKPRR